MQFRLNHPRGLYVCFMTEMWERFSYYGMRALLMLYLTKHFLFSDNQGFAIYGAYTSLVYAAPVIGGLVADRYLGSRKAVVVGAVLLVLGHFGMAFEGGPATETLGPDGTTTVTRDPFFLQIFYLSLALIIIGVGFLKANIATIVGKLYPDNDPRRDSGFTIFYVGINLGAFIASLACGYVGETYGWRYGFGMAGVGMLFGLFVFLRGQPLLEGHAEPPAPHKLREKVLGGIISRENLIYTGGALAILPAWFLVQNTAITGSLLGVFGVACSLGVIIFSFLKCTAIERDRMLAAMALMFFSVCFWSFYEQAGSSMNLFADRNVNRDLQLIGGVVPASALQSLNSMYILAFGPLFALLWIWLGKRGIEPSTPVKFALGIIQLALGFGAMVVGAYLAGPDSKVALVWLALAYFLHTSGELCLSPVGLSMITKLSVKRVMAMMMGIWYLSIAGAQFLAALVAESTGAPTVNGQVADARTSLTLYATTFEYIFWTSLAVGVVMLLFAPVFKRYMHGVH